MVTDGLPGTRYAMCLLGLDAARAAIVDAAVRTFPHGRVDGAGTP